MPPIGEPEIKLGPKPEGATNALGSPSSSPASPSAPPPGGVERRRHPRVPLPVDIRIRTTRSMHAATGIDVSLGGVSLCAPDLALNIGDQVILNIAQPGTNFTFRLDAVVRRTLPSPHPGTFAFGFEFLPLDGTRQTLLAEFLEAAAAAVAARQGRTP
jgi:c-di-GMP-binding flagellar brake protein YcgR